jgi:beta-glucosidase
MMKKYNILFCLILCLNLAMAQKNYEFKPFVPPVSYNDAEKRATEMLSKFTLEEKAQLIGGHNLFFIKGFENHKIPQLYLSDATQGVHIRKELSSLIEKTTAFPCPISLAATWNPQLAYEYARCIGEECRAGDIAVLLGPGMNIYRLSQNGRNFEYFGEDPFLAVRMIENYVVGMQSTGTMATLKHFLCNNHEQFRRTSNAIVDERTLHEIYLPAFKAGIDAGAMCVMTSYNQVNGEWAGQSEYVIKKLLREDLGFKNLVMSDWWSTWDPVKTIKSGLDLEMPGHSIPSIPPLWLMGDIWVKTNAVRLVKEGKVNESDIDRMAKNIMRTCIMMGLYERPVKDASYLKNFDAHDKQALETAREAMVLLRNEANILPINKSKKVLLTGEFADKIARGMGSAEVEGFNNLTLLEAMKAEFGANLTFAKRPSTAQLKAADVVVLSIGTVDSEGWDKTFDQPNLDKKVHDLAAKHPNVIIVVNAGGGINMAKWNTKVKALIYSWYAGQNGAKALSEIICGKTNPSGKLPISIEKKFEDSPGFGYIPKGEKMNSGWLHDMDMKHPVTQLEYKEGVFVGYRWYEAKKIEPLYPFGFGLSYTTFEIGKPKISAETIQKGEKLTIEFTLKNSGKLEGQEVVQLYVQDLSASVARPLKELKAFQKIKLTPGEEQTVKMVLSEEDFAFWDVNKKGWNVEAGDFNLHIGTSSTDIQHIVSVSFK